MAYNSLLFGATLGSSAILTFININHALMKNVLVYELLVLPTKDRINIKLSNGKAFDVAMEDFKLVKIGNGTFILDYIDNTGRKFKCNVAYKGFPFLYLNQEVLLAISNPDVKKIA